MVSSLKSTIHYSNRIRSEDKMVVGKYFFIHQHLLSNFAVEASKTNGGFRKAEERVGKLKSILCNIHGIVVHPAQRIYLNS